jgi:neutral ceramidase
MRLSLFLALMLAAPATAAELQAGAASIDITPPTGHPMWGYAARKAAPCEGVRDPLHARALVLAMDKQRIALVSLDLGRAPPRESTARIRARVKADARIDTILLVASHTHHGPVIETADAWPTPKAPYARELEKKLGDVIVSATKNLKPARLGVLSKEVTFNRNRHSKLADKPVDRELLLLRVEDADGKPIAHAVNFAAHPTMLPVKLHHFSPDFPGAMAAVVEKETGVPCLFLQGAAGDLSPDPARGREADDFGKALGQEVLALSRKVRCEALKKGTLQVHEDEFTFKSRVDFRNEAVKLAFSIAFFPELVAFYEKEYRDGIRPSLTTVLLDGRIGFVGVSGEFFSSHSLNLKRRTRLDHVFFLGYCNDYHQYFPTIEAAAEGGYGADPTVSPVEVGAGEKMMDQALIRLYKMRGRMPNLPPQAEK